MDMTDTVDTVPTAFANKDADAGAEYYRRYVSGDDGAFELLVREFRDGLTLYLYSFTGSAVDAEELMEDTFVKLAVKKPRFYGKCTFKTWLYRIARNVAVDAYRKKKNVADTPVDELEISSEEESLEETCIREEEKMRLHRAMSRLHADYRQVLYLSYFDDLGTKQIAAVMRKNERQVANLLYRAKAALKNELIREGFTNEKL